MFNEGSAKHKANGKNQNGFHDFGYYDVSDADISAIERCNGVIGIIPETFFLVAGNTNMICKGYKPCDYWKGIDYMVETMIEINMRTQKQNFDHVGIGTDFDGFADMPHDFITYRRMKDLKERMASRMDTNGQRVISDDQIKKIMHDNAMRVLENGWG
jgi:microsomal dipeptidase-like Zn-dependent dipeptidase